MDIDQDEAEESQEKEGERTRDPDLIPHAASFTHLQGLREGLRQAQDAATRRR